MGGLRIRCSKKRKSSDKERTGSEASWRFTEMSSEFQSSSALTVSMASTQRCKVQRSWPCQPHSICIVAHSQYIRKAGIHAAFYGAESALSRVRLWVLCTLPCNGVGNKCNGRWAFFLTTLGSQQSLAVHTQSWVVSETVRVQQQSHAFQTFLLCHRCIVPVHPLETSASFITASSLISWADWKVCADGNLLGGENPEMFWLTHLLKCLYVLLQFKLSALGFPLDMSITSIF